MTDEHIDDPAHSEEADRAALAEAAEGLFGDGEDESQTEEIERHIEHLQQERDLLQQLQRESAPAVRSLLALQTRAYTQQIEELQDQLATLVATVSDLKGMSGEPLIAGARFRGTATLRTTYSHARGPFNQSISIGLVFDAGGGVTITSFPPIRTERFDTPLGSNVTTISRRGGGTGSYGNGHLVLSLSLRFSHSHRLIRGSDLSLVLSTNPPGSPIDPGPRFGDVTLAGSGPFEGGVLGGERADLTISGQIASTGAQPTTVPHVRELDPATAARQVTAADLEPRFTGDSEAPGAWVWSQSPRGGSTVLRGTTVTMLLRSGPRL